MNIANVLIDSDPRTQWPILLYLHSLTLRAIDQSPQGHYQALARVHAG